MTNSERKKHQLAAHYTQRAQLPFNKKIKFSVISALKLAAASIFLSQAALVLAEDLPELQLAAMDSQAPVPYSEQTLILLRRANRVSEQFEYNPTVAINTNTAIAEMEPALIWRDDTVQNGDTLSGIFDRHGLGFSEWKPILALGGETRRLKRLRPGTQFRMAFDSYDQFSAMEVTINELDTLRIDRIYQDFHAKVIKDSADGRMVTASGIVDNSLFVSAKEAGLSDRLTMNLTNIFAWDIDFAKDIRSGDSFSVVYEKLYKNGRYLKNGEILAAEFSSRGRTVRAIRYKDSNGESAYYSPEGRSMKKAFLRTPGDFTRISSKFTKARLHPIKKVWRAHKGVDYAAPKGTNIVASGSGKIKFIGNQRGYGKVVIIDHSRGYTTLYAHMSKFVSGMRKGQRVTQGDVIGHVGMSGAATGPHLHYEFRVDGAHQNPLTMDLPMAAPISSWKMAEFRRQATPLINELNMLRSTQVATYR